MKIAFIGTHGTGKTTLCFQLAAHLKRLDRHVDLVKEVARHSPLPLNRQTTLDAQRWILHTQIAEEIAAEARHDCVVCDRSVLDNYAYLVHRVGRRPVLDALVREYLPGYTALFRVPVLGELSFDGVRDTSPAFQREIDGVIDTLIDGLGASTVPLSRTEPDRWMAEILAHLELPLDPPQMRLFDDDDGNPPA